MKLLNKEIEQSAGDLFVFLGQSHPHNVSVDVERTDDHGLREGGLNSLLSLEMRVDLGPDLTGALFLFSCKAPVMCRVHTKGMNKI